jgi:hypothetical protein
MSFRWRTDVIEQPGELLHTRQVRVEAFAIGDNMMLIRGALRDERPQPIRLTQGGVIPTGVVHDFRLDLTVSYQDFTITAVDATMPHFPMDACQETLPSLQKLVGQRIVGGFTRKVQGLLGGPRGCTHFVSLVLAMVPIAIQGYSAVAGLNKAQPRREYSASRLKLVANTCRVWAEDGPLVRRLREQLEPDERQ